MKINKLLALVGLGMMTTGAMAQTDVTATYLTNADFSQGTPVTVGVCTYANDKAGNGTDYANLVNVDGWTAVSSADGKAGGLFAIGGGAWLGGKGFTAPATDSDGNTGVNVLGVVTCWGASVQYTQDLKSALPAGTYTLVLAAYNSGAGQNDITANLIGFVEAGGTTHYASTKKYNSNTWKYEFITFTLAEATSGKISIGYTGAGSSTNLPHLFISGLQLFDGEVDAEAYEAAKTAAREAKEAKVLWDNAKSAAETAVADDAYANVTGSEKVALQAEIAKSEPTTTDGYKEATTALTNATSAFTAAKGTYDMAAALPTLAYADSGKKPAITSETTAASLITAIRAYYESHALAEGVDGAVNMTSSIANATNPTNNNDWTWSGNKNNPKSNEPWTDADGTSTHSYFDGGNWSASSWTTTMTQTISIPAGKYLLTAKARAAVNTTFTMSVGTSSVELPHIGSTGNIFNRGWGDASLEFETDGNDVDILVTASSETVHEWFSISDFRLVRLELYTEMAKAEDYEALAAAIQAAEAKTIGFAAGEYAPYNNVEALKAIAAAKAINVEVENAKEDILALTAKLGEWTVNTATLPAIFDGQFETTEANTTSGDIILPGWTKVQGIRLLVKDEATDPGLAYTDGKAAVFSWGGTTLTYGEQTGYTLPLNKHSLYALTLKVAGWRDGDLPNHMSVSLDGVEYTLDPKVTGRINAAEGNPFVEVKFFVTPTADNSILNIYCNHHFAIADLALEEVPESDVTMTIGTAKYATFIAPFPVQIPEGVTASKVSGVAEDGQSLVLEAVENEIPANTPVVLFSENVVNKTITGQSRAVENTYTAGLLTGVYADQDAVAGSYVLQNQAAGVGFYKVEETIPTVGANHAYLTYEAPAEIKAFVLGGTTTGIAALKEAALKGAVYNLAGQRVNGAQKGIYIVNGKKVIK